MNQIRASPVSFEAFGPIRLSASPPDGGPAQGLRGDPAVLFLLRIPEIDRDEIREYFDKQGMIAK